MQEFVITLWFRDTFISGYNISRQCLIWILDYLVFLMYPPHTAMVMQLAHQSAERGLLIELTAGLYRNVWRGAKLSARYVSSLCAP